MARKTLVGGSVVRTWAKSTEGQDFLAAWAAENEVEVPTVGDRGKFSEALVTAFHKANKGAKYEPKHVASIKVSGTRVLDDGKKIPVTMNATPAELRAFAKANGAGDRGRISAEIKAKFAAQPKA